MANDKISLKANKKFFRFLYENKELIDFWRL